MLHTQVCSSFSYPKRPNKKQDGLMRKIRSMNPQENGSVTPFQVPGKSILDTLNRFEEKSQFRCDSLRHHPLFNNLENIQKRCCRSFRRYCSPITLEQDYASKLEGDQSTSFWKTLLKHLNAFYRFSRPHTIIGTVVGITSISLLPLSTLDDISPTFIMGLLKALVSAVLMNIYVVGLNQLFDVKIDKVNKPYLPLASGEFSMEIGTLIIVVFSLMSFAIGFMSQSPPLLYALLASFTLGSAYSIELPLLRWKKNAFLAATCILFVRAIVVQLAFFVHIQKHVLGRPVILTRPLVFATAFMCFFSTVIALFKDIPDVDGDRHYGIQSFSVSLGQGKVFWLCISMLLMVYGTAMIVGASSRFLYGKLITVLGHFMLASILWLRATSIDLSNKASTTSFYMFIWKLFYVEYLLIPFMR